MVTLRCNHEGGPGQPGPLLTMRVINDCFDPLYGMLKANQWIPNDGYGHRLLKAGTVRRDDQAGYDTKVVRPKPKSKPAPKPKAKRVSRNDDDTERLVNNGGDASN